MKELFWLIKNTLKVTFKNKRSYIIYFGLPLVGILIAFMAYGNPGQAELQVGIVDQDHSVLSKDTTQFVEGLKNVKVTKINSDQVKDKVASGDLDCVLTLGQGFSDSLKSGAPGHVELTSIKGAQITAFVKSYLYNDLDNIAAIGKASGDHPNAFNKIYQSYKQEHFKLTTATLKDTSKNKDMTNQTIGFLLMLLLISAGNLGEIILKEKEGRTYFRLLSTPITARMYVLSNVLVSLIIMSCQILVTLFMMTNVFHIQTSVPLVEMFILLFLFALVAIGLSLITVTFASSTASSGAIQNLIIVPTCMLSGCFWPVKIMPDTAQKIADFLPQRWVLASLDKLQSGVDLNSIYLNILIIISFALVFFLIAIYRFGRNNNVRNFI
ncbi:ABC transporter permease [Falsibacillus albus]|uniref:Transport permease protein n=1 Tax=Falsibacillus albus TaxID=2478915 RepID=A0A3L7K311_9BACI|nr:ABC transporter permease [Falsibacillus albus]RLQ96739.1 ABC transporter permease [Falsibacillus albus]